MGSTFDPTSSDFLGGGIGGSLVDPLNLGNRPGGKGGKGATPEAPDFTAAAEAQARASQELSREQTAANRPNQSSPFGSSQWSLGPDGQWTQTTALSPELQARAGGLMGEIANAGPIGTGDEARQQAIDSAYGQAISRLDPQWAQREESTRARLAAQGLDPGSEAFGAEMGNFSRGRNDAYSSAMANAIGQGTTAGSVAFQNNLAAANNPFQQLGMLQGLGAQPGFTSAGSGQAPQYLNAANLGYQGALNQYGIDQGGKNSQMSGAAALLPLFLQAAPAAASDERLKMNIERSQIEAIPGVPLASWEWKDAPGERHYGVIAQDLQKVRPDLVHYREDGMRMVDYGGLLRSTP